MKTWGRPHPNPPPEGEGIYWVLGWGLAAFILSWSIIILSLSKDENLGTPPP